MRGCSVCDPFLKEDMLHNKYKFNNIKLETIKYNIHMCRNMTSRRSFLCLKTHNL